MTEGTHAKVINRSTLDGSEVSFSWRNAIKADFITRAWISIKLILLFEVSWIISWGKYEI